MLNYTIKQFFVNENAQYKAANNKKMQLTFSNWQLLFAHKKKYMTILSSWQSYSAVRHPYP
jgi:hypothetical protein